MEKVTRAKADQGQLICGVGWIRRVEVGARKANKANGTNRMDRKARRVFKKTGLAWDRRVRFGIGRSKRCLGVVERAAPALSRKLCPHYLGFIIGFAER